MKKLNLLNFPRFWFDPVTKIENSEISESFILFQSLTLVVTQNLRQKKWIDKKIKRSWYCLIKKKPVSEVSEFSISDNSRFKNDKKMNWAKNWKVPIWF